MTRARRVFGLGRGRLCCFNCTCSRDRKRKIYLIRKHFFGVVRLWQWGRSHSYHSRAQSLAVMITRCTKTDFFTCTHTQIKWSMWECDLITILGRAFSVHSGHHLKMDTKFLTSQFISYCIKRTRGGKLVAFFFPFVFLEGWTQTSVFVCPSPPIIGRNIWKLQIEFSCCVPRTLLIRHLSSPSSLSGPWSQPHWGPAESRAEQQNSPDPEPCGPGPGPRELDPAHRVHRGRGVFNFLNVWTTAKPLTSVKAVFKKKKNIVVTWHRMLLNMWRTHKKCWLKKHCSCIRCRCF